MSVSKKLVESIEVWRALKRVSREAILYSMKSDRDRIEEQTENFVLAHDIEARDEVLATCDAAISLLRSASEPEQVSE